jgi:two-component system chemotaxis response regulator CheY
MNALVVEKSKTMRSVLRRLLSMRGFAVSEAADGRNALDVLHKLGAPEVVLVDWIPCETDSLEFISCLRKRDAREALIIMLAAAEPGIREVQSALIAGADDYLMKPFTSKQIDEKLARAGLRFQLAG